MADWYGAARTNYFTSIDLNGLRASIQAFFLRIAERDDGRVCLLSSNDSGCWPYVAWNDETEEETPFNMATHVMPFVQEGVVVIVMETGAEKLRYVTGWAKAYVRQGEVVRECGVDLDEIYGKAAAEFGVAIEEISHATY